MLEYHSQIRVSPLHPLGSYQIMDVVLHAKFGDSQLSAFKILKWPRNQDAVNINIRLGPPPPPPPNLGLVVAEQIVKTGGGEAP